MASTPRSERISIGSGELEDARAGGYFTIRSTKDDVLAIQGTPDSFTESTFRYGFSRVYFDGDGHVTSWENSALRELKVKMLPMATSHRSFFTVGSSKDDVLAAQGTPDSFTESAFRYGFSRAYFDSDGRVTNWENSALKELKVRMQATVPVESSTFTIGSTKDEVLAIQGTPDSITYSMFQYGFSRVYFDHQGRVTNWENSALRELKVQMVPHRASREGEDR